MGDVTDEPGLGAGLAALFLLVLAVILYVAAMYYALFTPDWRRALFAAALSVAGAVAFTLFSKAWGIGKDKKR